jgi:hypothetical protein
MQNQLVLDLGNSLSWCKNNIKLLLHCITMGDKECSTFGEGLKKIWAEMENGGVLSVLER